MATFFRRSIPVLLLFLGIEAATGQSSQARKEKVIQLPIRAELDGLQPNRLEVEEGDYLIFLRNGIYKSALTLVLDDDKAVKQSEKAGRELSGRIQLEVSLKPGKYIVRVTENPRMQMEVLVSPKK